MFVGITNTPRDYAWGSRTAIADVLGRQASGGPEAEYWLGTHPASPALLASNSTSLASVTSLPYLLKVLAAERPLSLQAHPNRKQAIAGFERENALGLPVDAAVRNYRDANHKPELIYALSDKFDALCGFRSAASTLALLRELGPDPLVTDFAARFVDDSSIPEVFAWLLSGGPDVDSLVARVVELAGSLPDSREFATVGALSDAYPGDPGIVVSLLLNRETLTRGQVLYLPAGNIHAYLSGTGIELMAASDNVLRGGLTPKHVDVAELLAVLDFTPLPAPILEAEHPVAGVSVFAPDVPDFQLVVVELPAGDAEHRPVAISLESDAIALCTSGRVVVRSASGGHDLAQGDAVYVSSDEKSLEFTGAGTIFIAMSRGV
jgi:mannose-6-phosphate isomerase